MTDLPPIVNWHGEKRQATTGEAARAEGTAARIREEVADIRAAAEQLASGSPLQAAVADFLTVQAKILERSGGTADRANGLTSDQDTREEPGMLPTAARSALLIARAQLGKE